MARRLTWAQRGQVTAETAVGIVCLVSALVFLAPYIQRAIQGNLFGSTESLGSQFDSRDAFREGQNMNMSETIHQKFDHSLIEAELIEPTPLNDQYWAHVKHPDWILSSLPSGPVPREPAFYQSEVSTNWSASGGGQHHDQR